jgi:hypothetical protein
MMTDNVPQGLTRRQTVLLAGALFAALALLVGAVGYRAFKHDEAEARAAHCMNNLRNLEVALLSYHDRYRTFPPAYVADAEGKPMHSWRVLILPFLDEGALYEQYSFDEPWNGPNNSKLADKLSHPHFRCTAADGDPLHTSYLAVVGEETAWPGPEPRGIRHIADGTHKTVALVEARDSGIHWMEPRDLTLEQAERGVDDSGRGISANHPKGPNAAYSDGHMDRLPKDPGTLRAVLTARGGEEFEYPVEGFGNQWDE